MKKFRVLITPLYLKVKRIGQFVLFFPIVLSSLERRIIVFLILVILISSFLWIKNWAGKNTLLSPARGGQFIEGVITGNPTEIQEILETLSLSGLTRFEEGKIVPSLATRWEINPEGKEYTFWLKENLSSPKIVDLATKQKIWQGIEIKSLDNHSLKFVLKQPYVPFLATTTHPFLPPGPYQIKKEDKNQIILEANKDFHSGAPFIQKIIIKKYFNLKDLTKAVKKKEIQGAVGLDKEKGFKSYKINLPHQLAIIFNLEREVFKKKEMRKKLVSDQKIDPGIEITLVTNEKLLGKAKEYQERWEKIGVKVNIKSVNDIFLQKEIVPKRDFDLLLYTFDYGTDPDPYPFWHSSQIKPPGMNLASYSSFKTDKLLEEARQTLDQEKRNRIYEEFWKIIKEEGIVIVLEDSISLPYLVSEKVKGVLDINGVRPADRFNQVWKWYLKEKRVRK